MIRTVENHTRVKLVLNDCGPGYEGRTVWAWEIFNGVKPFAQGALVADSANDAKAAAILAAVDSAPNQKARNGALSLMLTTLK